MPRILSFGAIINKSCLLGALAHASNNAVINQVNQNAHDVSHNGSPERGWLPKDAYVFNESLYAGAGKNKLKQTTDNCQNPRVLRRENDCSNHAGNHSDRGEAKPGPPGVDPFNGGSYSDNDIKYHYYAEDYVWPFELHIKRTALLENLSKPQLLRQMRTSASQSTKLR